VRVIEYTLTDPGRRTSVDRYRLVTTILDPAAAPAHELAALYTERWEVETALAELKTTQRGPKQVLRSKSPELVAQEVWAHLLVHYALRAVMHPAALAEDLDPDRLSFIRSLRVIRRQVIAAPAFPPEQLTAAIRVVVEELLTVLLPKRRLRSFPRAVKRKMSNSQLKRAAHRTWPQPTMPPADGVGVLPATPPGTSCRSP
jgi:hypothetical protein